LQVRYSGRFASLLGAIIAVLMMACLLCVSPALAKTYSIEEVEGLISELPNCSDVTEDDRDQIEEALAAYESLSEADQKKIDDTDGVASYGSQQPYGRILEVAVWGLWSLEVPDNSTTLADATYSATSDPALTSQYSKGKSTSPRDRPWSVKEVVVKDGKATATLTVESTSYPRIKYAGQWFNEDEAVGGNCIFRNVPIDLNSTFYFCGDSSSMPVPIAFSLTTSIDEGAEVVETPMDRAKRLIAALPADPFDITIDDTASILEATNAYEALTDEQRAELCDAENPSSIVSNSHSYGRYLESARWTLDSLKPVDNATTLADGTYTGQVDSAINWGLSTTLRKLGFSVKSLLVRNGRAYAMLEHASDTSDKLRVGGVEYKNLNTSGSGHSVFEIPLALNSTMHFSVLAKGANSNTKAIAYEITNTADVSSMKPDPVSKTDDSSGDNSANQGSEASAADSSAATSPSSDSKLIKKLNKNLNKWLEHITTLLKKQAKSGGSATPAAATGNGSSRTQTAAPATQARPASAATAASGKSAKAAEASSGSGKEGADDAEEATGEQVEAPEEETPAAAQDDAESSSEESVLLVGLATLLAALAGAGGYTVGFVRSENKLKLQ